MLIAMKAATDARLKKNISNSVHKNGTLSIKQASARQGFAGHFAIVLFAGNQGALTG
jgi:hypothetical protein